MPKVAPKKTDMPQVGDKAPDFNSLDQTGKKVALKEFKGKTVLLYFYPKDNTPGCTKQACSLRDRFSTLKKKGIIVLGVSKDSQKSHQGFIEKYDLPFTLISDTDKELQCSYGVWKEKNMYGKKVMGTARTTFVIGPDQKIAHVFNKIDCENHAEEVLEKLEELGLV
jgi:peroxiredoxin Q/BCP